MNKIVLLLFFIFSINIFNLLSQDIQCIDSIVTVDNIVNHNFYGLSDFTKADKQLPVSYNSLIIEFDSLNRFEAEGGNGYHGDYKILEANRFEFSNVFQTLLCITAINKKGFEFNPDLFADSLVITNNACFSDKGLSFFKDSTYILSIKPYYDLLNFPLRKDLKKLNVVEVKIDSAKIKKEFLLIDSRDDLLKYNVVISDTSFGLNNHALLIYKSNVENLLKDYSLKQRLKYLFRTGEFRAPKFPVSYAKYYYDNKVNKYYLDIVDSYSLGNIPYWYRDGKYTGFLIEKTTLNNIIVTTNK